MGAAPNTAHASCVGAILDGGADVGRATATSPSDSSGHVGYLRGGASAAEGERAQGVRFQTRQLRPARAQCARSRARAPHARAPRAR
eukprot:CAMPEP_0175657542 /NCGR_PEP_ID=MMETSP0097-20121207/12974_1 /TAXON_ID=311494 /ORGANISM="Alexandrium monilatum, Strain CCMP3105" /LENGTH=86 /DNA_ID=CAMNT_0016963641 /DNA_START=58 /DNA_END=316 /DNA_ORIENTATION=+